MGRLICLRPSARRSSGRIDAIPQDLWDSVIDFSSGDAYHWNGSEATAVSPEEASGSGHSRLPTLTRDEFNKWANDFAAAQVEADPALEKPMQEWEEARWGVASLPPSLRSEWLANLKEHVLVQLESWFESKGLQAPSDLVQDVSYERGQTPETEELRKFIQDSVRVMTRAELEELRFPSSVFLRARPERTDR